MKPEQDAQIESHCEFHRESEHESEHESQREFHFEPHQELIRESACESAHESQREFQRETPSEYRRRGPLMALSSYPPWAQDMVLATQQAKARVVDHELFAMMKEARLPEQVSRLFFIGGWPIIEQFPQYMATNLCKIQYGRSHGENMARKYLMKNIRVEQNHADHWVDWAEACGVARPDLFGASDVTIESRALNHWCWHSCHRDSLATSMAATNLAIEGATGEWAARICASDVYENSFDPSVRRTATRWLKLHAHYDDTHPWEALDIICTLIGPQADSKYVTFLEHCVNNSYAYMALSLDRCLLLRH